MLCVHNQLCLAGANFLLSPLASCGQNCEQATAKFLCSHCSLIPCSTHHVGTGSSFWNRSPSRTECNVLQPMHMRLVPGPPTPTSLHCDSAHKLITHVAVAESSSQICLEMVNKSELHRVKKQRKGHMPFF